jgi:hypothetical protein
LRENTISEPVKAEDDLKFDAGKSALDKELHRVHEVWFAKRVNSDSRQRKGFGTASKPLKIRKGSCMTREGRTKK